MLVAGLLLSSSTVLPSNTNILKENSEGGVSSRGMSPLNPRRVIRFDESCCNEEPVDDHFVDESEEDEELESKEDTSEDDSFAEKWLDRLSNMEDEKLIQEADTFFASSISTTSGVYIVEDELGAVGVWKPEQEEYTKHEGPLRKVRFCFCFSLLLSDTQSQHRAFNRVMVRYVRSQRMHWTGLPVTFVPECLLLSCIAMVLCSDS